MQLVQYMDIQRILVGTDISENALIAVDNAIAVARRTGAKVVLAYATPYVDPDGDKPSILDQTEAQKELTRMHLMDAEGELEWLAARCSERGVTVNTEVLSGLPAEALIDESERINANLVVVGTHGYTGFQRLLLGSVAERVVRGAPASVMVARGRPPDNGFMRILVATDFSASAEEALRAAKVLAAERGRIDVVHCWQTPLLMPGGSNGNLPPVGPQIDRTRTDLRVDAIREGEELIERHHTDRCALSFELIEDAPARGIQSRLESGAYDCAIVGSHGRRGIKRWLLGSVAEQTVRYSPCTTVVVRS